MITLKNISKKHGTKTVLANVNTTIEQGDFIVIVGTNGSGKTTLFDLIAGAQAPTDGTITLDNTNITATDAKARGRWMGRLLQNPEHNTVGTMTVAQNLALALFAKQSATLADALKIVTPDIINDIQKDYDVDLKPLLHTLMKSLSGGQRQLIAFIMATLTQPRLLLLDEPTAALDPQSATTLLACAHRFIHQHHMTALLITHDPQIALTLGNKLWLVKDGTVTIFDQEAKKALEPHDLIGSIDYAKITA
ncbi:ATP-binding cassette domain-containing protein [Candidatus Babeliales bacterium]|nr:ATP-binding cassette domain-containing protein [Candidatus Babeliales bacterium]